MGNIIASCAAGSEHERNIPSEKEKDSERRQKEENRPFGVLKGT